MSRIYIEKIMNIFRNTYPADLMITAVAASALVWLIDPRMEIPVSEERLQAGLQSEVPIKRRVGPFKVEVDNILIDIREEGLLNLRIASEIDGPGAAGATLIDLNAGMSWDHGKISIENFDITSVDYVNGVDMPEPGEMITDDWRNLRSEIADLKSRSTTLESFQINLLESTVMSMEEIINQRFAERPALDLDTLGPKGVIGKHFLKDIRITDSAVQADLVFSNNVTHGALWAIAIIFGLLHLLHLHREDQDIVDLKSNET